VLLHELRDSSGGESGPVGPDQELTVRVRAGPDADGGDVELFGDALGGIRRDHLEHDRERAGLLDRVRVSDELLDALAEALDDVSAELVLALGGEADVR